MAATRRDKTAAPELWRILVRRAFDDFLSEALIKGPQPSSARWRQERLVTILEETVESQSATQDGDGPEDRSRVAVRPAMPSRSVLPQMLAIVAFARCLKTVEDLRSVCEPGQLTQFSLRGVDEDDDKICRALKGALKCWADFFRVRNRTKEMLVRVVPGGTDDGGRLTPTSRKNFRSRIEDELRQGEALVIIARDLGLFLPDHQRLVGMRFDPPPLNRSALIEILRVLKPSLARSGKHFMEKMLPDDRAISKLTTTEIEIALRQENSKALFRRLNQQKTASLVPTVTLDNVYGQDRAVSIFRSILCDLDRWRLGELDWSEATTSAVMYGPPGNGKTLLASAVSGSAGLPLITGSYAQFQAFGHQGDMLRAMKDTFEQAIDQAPSVLFLDELDSFSTRGGHNHNQEYLRGVVNGLLTQLSTAARTPGLILLGATNDLSVIDPAVIRPGRFDLRIPILNPDLQGVRNILSAYLATVKGHDVSEPDVQDIAMRLLGSSAAEVASFARQALGQARAAERAVTKADFLDVIGGERERSTDEYRRAIHESGHAVARVLSSLPNPTRVQIARGGGFVMAQIPPVITSETAMEELVCSLAGRAAEAVCLGSISSGGGEGSNSDLAFATHFALRTVTEWHLDDLPPVWFSADLALAVGIPPHLRLPVEQLLIEAERRARELIKEWQSAVEGLAAQLLVVREMGEAELLACLRELQISISPSTK